MLLRGHGCSWPSHAFSLPLGVVTNASVTRSWCKVEENNYNSNGIFLEVEVWRFDADARSGRFMQVKKSDGEELEKNLLRT